MEIAVLSSQSRSSEASNGSLATQKYPTPPLSPRRDMENTFAAPVDLTKGTGVFGDDDDDDDIFAAIPDLAATSGAGQGSGPPQDAGGHAYNDPKCACGLPCDIKTSNTAKDYGRQFWTCPKEPGDGKCASFAWHDQSSQSGQAVPAVELSLRDLGGATGRPGPPGTGVFSEAPAAYGSFADAGPEHPEWQQPSEEQQVPLCWCRPPGPAVVKTSNSSANPGRDYWTCEKAFSMKCKFFAWCDEPPRAGQQFQPLPGQGQQTPQKPKRGRSGGSDDAQWSPPSSAQKRARGPEVTQLCHCNEPCIQRTSNTQANPGREFFVCAKQRDTPENCAFFLWADEAGKKREALASPGGHGYGGPPSAGFGARHSGGFAGPPPSGGRGGASPAGRSDACYKCGEAGHWASACPKATTPGSASRGGGWAGGGRGRGRLPVTGIDVVDAWIEGGGSGQFGTCYRCGQRGHWAPVCPQGRGRG